MTCKHGDIHQRIPLVNKQVTCRPFNTNMFNNIFVLSLLFAPFCSSSVNFGGRSRISSGSMSAFSFYHSSYRTTRKAYYTFFTTTPPPPTHTATNTRTSYVSYVDGQRLAKGRLQRATTSIFCDMNKLQYNHRLRAHYSHDANSYDKEQDTEPQQEEQTYLKAASSTTQFTFFEETAEDFRNCSSIAEVQTLLVQKGLEWKQRQRRQQVHHQQQKEQRNTVFSSLEKVAGCVANVNVQTVLSRTIRRETVIVDDAHTTAATTGETANDCYYYNVSFFGNSDALLSQGLLAVLTTALSNSSYVEDILKINPHHVADQIGIRHALSRGRNDGLANMMTLIQHQIQSLLPRFDNANTNIKYNENENVFKKRNSEIITITHNHTRSNSISDSSNDSCYPSTTTIIDMTKQQKQRKKKTPYGVDDLAKEVVALSLLPSSQKGEKVVTSINTTILPKDKVVAATPTLIDNKEISKTKNVALLLSGGVDSSVALNLLLQKQREDDEHHYNITAFYLKIWLEDELAHLNECPWEDDYKVCQDVCKHAGNIPLESISLQEEYKQEIISYTIEEASKGRTPNPDILCNSRIKFGVFFKYAIHQRGFDYIATGHYAKLVAEKKIGEEDKIYYHLHRAPDPVKDQSYFLCALNQTQLRHVLFPIGHLRKADVRQLASPDHFHLPNHDRHDSQGLCFLGKVKFNEFLKNYLGTKPGNILDAFSGKIIGRHNGIWYHTVGQRKGVGIFLNDEVAAFGPWYVVAKDVNKDIVYCSNQYNDEIFTSTRSQFVVEDLHWIQGKPPPVPYEEVCSSSRLHRFDMKIRHGPKLIQGVLELFHDDDGNNNNKYIGNVQLDRKDGGLAPGQYVVFYDKESDECLGSGVISENHWIKFLSTHNATSQNKNNNNPTNTL